VGGNGPREGFETQKQGTSVNVKNEISYDCERGEKGYRTSPVEAEEGFPYHIDDGKTKDKGGWTSLPNKCKRGNTTSYPTCVNFVTQRRLKEKAKEKTFDIRIQGGNGQGPNLLPIAKRRKNCKGRKGSILSGLTGDAQRRGVKRNGCDGGEEGRRFT